MWYGRMTNELEQLYDEYYDIFKCDPDGYMEVEYGQGSYKDYVRDIKKSIEMKIELPNVV